MAPKLIVVLLGATAAALVSASGAAAEIKTRDSGHRFAPGEAIVRFAPGVSAAERRDTRIDAGVSFEESLRLARAQVVSFGGSVGAAIERLEDEPGVAYAQPNYRYHALADPPNDTHFGHPALWGLRAVPGVDVLPAWDRTRGAGQIIAVLDTGVDLTHPDLAGNLWTGPGGIHGHDFIHGDSDPSDHQYHGTHVAGTAAAIANNGQGVSGVAPEADIMAVRVLDGDGAGFTSGIIDGIAFASANGAGVINMSLGGPSGGADTAMQNAARAAEQSGSMIVAAAGNDANNNDVTPFSPCNTDAANIICVAAVDNQSELASYSNFGATSVDVGAPGGDVQAGEEEILSTKPSWAAPLVPIENFEDISDWTGTTNSTPWGTSGSAGSRFVADSPSGNYLPDTQSQLLANNSVSLAGQQGCRIHFDGRLAIENDVDQNGNPFDFLTVGAVAGTASDGVEFFEFTSGFGFHQLDASISDLDGLLVKPRLRFTSDDFFEFAGADVDNLKIICRGSTYNGLVVADSDEFELPASGGGGDYMAISGTSMATPHVAGVAALVRAADPGASPSQIVQAIKNGVEALPSLSGFTVTGGAVDAVRAIDASLAIPNPEQPPPPPPPPPATPSPPGKARIARVSVNNRGVVTMVVRGDAGTRGVAALRANITRTRAARVMRVARKSFRIGSRRRATVQLRLKKPALRQLRRTRKLRLRARIVLRNAAGLSSTANRTIRLRLRRR